MSSIVSEAAPLQNEPALAQTAGAWLRQQRQQRGLHIVALAAMLKVPQGKLEALEADRLDELPDATFTRALATAMCRALKVDAAPVMALLPRSTEPELNVSRGLNKPYRDRDSRTEGLSLELVKRPVVWGSGLLLAAAAVVYVLPADVFERNQKTEVEAASAAPVEAVPATLVDAPLAQSPASEAALSVAGNVPAVPVVPAVTASAPTKAPGAVSTGGPNALTPSVTTTGATHSAMAPQVPASLPPAAPVAGAVPLLVKVNAESWVEVVDARGQTLLSKLLRPGDVQSLSGLPPLKVRVGNVAGTELILRGSSVDLASQSRDNVARLELN